MDSCSVFTEYAREIKVHTNTKCITDNPHGMVYEVNGTEGTGTVEVLHLFPGVFLQFHSFHCRAFRLPAGNSIGSGLKINFCMEGRTEVIMSDHMCLVVEPGVLSLETRMAQDVFRFPSGHYQGVELFLYDGDVENGLPKIWKDFGIDPKKIRDRFCKSGGNYAVYADERFRSLFLSMMDAPPECRPGYLKMKVTELLFLLQNSVLPDKSNVGSFMTMGQVEIAKQVMEIITEDLGQHISVESLAKPFGISASSVKNYFQGVYGKNISGYLREARMSAAAVALREGSRPVAEIALAVGYENASKFSAAFKNHFGESPLEYRRQSRCGICG